MIQVEFLRKRTTTCEILSPGSASGQQVSFDATIKLQEKWEKEHSEQLARRLSQES